jgi:Protein of unknown function (DUF1592)/Protein of unknown function (DUF1588)/Protein of unknown function (DUF1595)/Protein of unknown function (DUF1585)
MKSLAACVLAIAGALGVVACGSGNQGKASPTGVGGNGVGGTTATGGSGGGTAAGGTAATCRADGSLAPARISLITDDEYTNMVRDVFGVTFVPETMAVRTGEYPLNENAEVASADVAKQYLRAADQVAAKLKPCGNAALGADCVESFLRQKLPRVWKRPVADAEIASLIAIFNGGLPDGGQRSLDLVMEAALGSGAFLYRTEIGTDASGPSGSVALSGYELANAVSFSLLATVPDDVLWAKAADGTIAQPAVLSAEVDRLLALEPARDILATKVGFYLDVEKIPVVSKDAKTFPEFTATLQSSLYQSAKLFLNDLVWNGSLSDLFTSNKYYANEEIAKVYGLPPVQGSGLVEIELPAERNAGILTHPGLLATSNQHTASDDIVHRGLWVYGNLVCGIAVGSPPANAASVAASLMGTERVKAQARDALPGCGVCHHYFDPFGMASESFDPIGRYRTIDPDDNLPVVSESTITDLGADIDGPVSSMKDIADRLKTGRRVADCAVVHLAEYTLDHNPNQENSCAIQQIKDNFAASGKFVDLFKAILTSPAFATRDLGSQ